MTQYLYKWQNKFYEFAMPFAQFSFSSTGFVMPTLIFLFYINFNKSISIIEYLDPNFLVSILYKKIMHFQLEYPQNLTPY